MGPQSDFGFAPDQQDVGMVALGFRELPNPVHERERLFEVGKLELPDNVVLVYHLPFRHLFVQSG